MDYETDMFPGWTVPSSIEEYVAYTLKESGASS